jgi:outer membrane protein assembly factor BamD
MRLGWIVLLLVSLLLGACASHRNDDELTESLYYQKAHKELTKEHYVKAISDLKELEARFPYSDYAEQAQLELIYADYQTADFANTVAAAQHFLNNYPSSKQIDYVLYLQGLGNYRLTESMFGRFFKRDIAARDLSSKRDAFNNFAELVRRFPDSKYAPDARSRMLYIRRLLAEHDLEVARYYASREAFIAAVNRAQRIVEHFQGTPQVEEALAIMSRCYTALKQPELAAESRKVLAYNWPKSQYLGKNGQIEIDWWPGQKSLLSLLTFDLL